MPPLYVLRHGQTEWNAAGRIQGWQDSPLTATGRAQAARQNRLLLAAGVGADGHDFLCSPLGRTRETAQIALAGLGSATPDPDLREITCGRWDGMLADEVRRIWPGIEGESMLQWYDRAEGGEGMAGLTARCDRVLRRVAASGRAAVLVTHGIASRVLRARVTGQDPETLAAPNGGQGEVALLRDGRQTWLNIDACSRGLA